MTGDLRILFQRRGQKVGARLLHGAWLRISDPTARLYRSPRRTLHFIADLQARCARWVCRLRRDLSARFKLLRHPRRRPYVGGLPLVSGRRIHGEVVDGRIAVKAVGDTFQVEIEESMHFREQIEAVIAAMESTVR